MEEQQNDMNNQEELNDELENLESSLNESLDNEKSTESDTSEATGSSTDDALQAQIDELKDKNLRLFAEFENFRRRTAKERFELMKTASQDTLSALLPVIDDFDRMKKTIDAQEEKDAFSEGVLLVYNKLFNTLTSLGLKVLDSDQKDFDAELHEAVTNFPVQDPALKGKIIDTVEKGYLLNDKLIRHAKVVVGS